MRIRCWLFGCRDEGLEYWDCSHCHADNATLNFIERGWFGFLHDVAWTVWRAIWGQWTD